MSDTSNNGERVRSRKVCQLRLHIILLGWSLFRGQTDGDYLMALSHEVTFLEAFKAPLLAEIDNADKSPIFHYSRCLCSESLGFGPRRHFTALDFDSLIGEAVGFLNMSELYRPTILCVETLRCIFLQN
jgi:hypothetical protein